jgi:hypothetical protein
MSGDQNSHIGQLSPNAITTVFTKETTGELLPAQYTTHLARSYLPLPHLPPLSLSFGDVKTKREAVQVFLASKLSKNFKILSSSVADPDPDPNPHVFGPPGSGSDPDPSIIKQK